MWHINKNAEYNNKGNDNFSSFNCIEQSSLVWSDDAVETFKRHAQYKESTA